MMRNKLGEGLQDLVYTIIMHEKAVTVADLADKVGCSPSTIYEYLERKPIIPVAILKALYELKPDPRIAAALAPRGMELVPEDSDRSALPSFESGMMDLVISKGELASLWQEATADGIIDRDESVSIDKLIHSMTRQLSALKSKKNEMRH